MIAPAIVNNLGVKMDGQDASTQERTRTTSNDNELEIKFKKQKDKEDFYTRLVDFHRHKNVNTPIINFPTLNGKLIDLRKLYNIVISFGGWERVCEKDKWTEVGLELDAKLFKSCLNAAHALKTIYIRYLSSYEKFDYHMSYGTNISQGATLSSLLDPLHNFNNPSLPHSMTMSTLNANNSSTGSNNLGYHKNSMPNLEDTMDSDINRRKFSYLIDMTPMTYNYAQHSLNHGLSASYILPNPYEKLEISLLSGLPNEVDFVFNTIVLLSSEDTNTFRVYQAPRLLSLMLAHVGFFGQTDKYNLKRLYETHWTRPVRREALSKAQLFEKYLASDELSLLSEKYENVSSSMCKRNFERFWHSLIRIPGEDFGQKELLKEIIPKLEEKEAETCAHSDVLNVHEIRHDIDDSVVPNSIEYKRVEQVLIVLNNLSFEDTNADFMANKCHEVFEFLLMCLYCTHPSYEIRKHSVDTLANLSRKLKLKNLSDKHRCLLLNAMYHLIIGDEEMNYSTEHDEEGDSIKVVPILERSDLIRGLEILTKLCSQEQLDTLNDEESVNNEKLIAKFELAFKEGKTVLLLERIFLRISEILPVQDILILLHSLEFMYNITQFNQFICNLLFDCCTSESNESGGHQCKLISVLIDFLSLDMSHFGVSSNNESASMSQIKMYKVMPANGQIVAVAQPLVNNTTNQVNANSPVAQTNAKSTSLLQQTLNNQHNSVAKPSPQPSAPVPKINQTCNDQQAKNILCNWLVTCFQTDQNSELSKTQLYPYYQQISKYNNWPVLTIPTFFEILNTTFPHLRYDEDSNKIHGLKLILNLKQQLELKHKFANIKSDTIPIQLQNQSQQSAANTQSFMGDQKLSEDSKNSLPLSPPSLVSINIPTSSINMPLLTPPPPMDPPVKLECENRDKNSVLTNGLNKTNVVSSQSKETVSDQDMIAQNEDSLMSNSSSSASAVSSSNSTTSLKETKTDEKSNKENDFILKRKIEAKDPIESKTLIKVLNESSQDSKSDSSTSSPIKKKKLKINEMEDFMNKPMAPITIVSNQFSNTIQVQFKSDPNPQPILITSNTPAVVHTTQPAQTPVVPQAPAAQQLAQTIQIVQVNQIENQLVGNNNGNYMCEWNNCNSFFTSSKAVYNHVCKYHLLNNNNASAADAEGQLCLWSGCDQIKRQKWSLVNHIQERHCNENAMKTAILCRQQGIVKTVNSQNLTNSHLNFSKEAALFAIQRHHRLKKEDFMSPPEGPITKSIRLLSALILRNLARNSEKGKKIIQNYESQLACVAFDLMESSNAISSCLWHLSH